MISYASEALRVDRVHWGWALSWAKDNKRPASINARVETVATNRFFNGLWPHGRALVPADHWYGREVAEFEWFPVNRAVGNIHNQGPELIEPIT